MTREWNSSAYHSLSDPQYRWGLNVLRKLQALPLRGNEFILDAGCGTGRVTAELMRALPEVRVTAVDGSENMVSQARKTLAEFGDRVTVKQCDLLELSSANKFDVVFSTAVFHWIKDHDRLFANLFRTLRPGGILLAQCGGGPNLQRLRVRTSKILQSPQFSSFFQGWERVWEYPDADLTAMRLKQAGFSDVETSLEAAPTPMPDEDTFRRFCSTVTLHPYLERVPEELQNGFLDPIVAEFAQDRPAFMLDYWRLNILARKAV
jgi:trans-aconitate 2-methyltransferase